MCLSCEYIRRWIARIVTIRSRAIHLIDGLADPAGNVAISLPAAAKRAWGCYIPYIVHLQTGVQWLQLTLRSPRRIYTRSISFPRNLSMCHQQSSYYDNAFFSIFMYLNCCTWVNLAIIDRGRITIITKHAFSIIYIIISCVMNVSAAVIHQRDFAIFIFNNLHNISV